MIRFSNITFSAIRLIEFGLAVTLSVCLCFFMLPCAAWADTESDLNEANSRVEQTSSAYQEAIEKAEKIDADIEALTARIAELEEQLPGQKAASNEAFVALYKLQQEGCSLLDMLLGAENIGDFLKKLDYINRLTAANQDALVKMINMQKELSEDQASLQEQKIEADAQRAEAEAALAQAQAAREAAQAAAEAQKRAEAEAIAKAEAEGKTPADMEVNVPADANQGSQAEGGSPDSVNKPPSSDGADWSSDRSSFISHWGGRIDSYLSGSPLSGQGSTFAAAAWDYGVDPRWSPAISCIESSKGAYCFRSHNAWGWGSVSWDSWEDAIYGHVGGLSRGYGYTITVAAAQKYCPPNWAFWYNRVSEEMNKI